MKKFKIVGVIVLGVLILAELTLSIISYHAGDIAEATYSLLWAVAMMLPFYNLMSSDKAGKVNEPISDLRDTLRKEYNINV